MNNFSVEFQEGIQEGENKTKLVNLAIKCKIKKTSIYEWICKKQHGYLQCSRKNIPNVDQNNTKIYLKKALLSSQVEWYFFTIQEEEVNTNLLVPKRDGQKNRNANCRIFKKEKERIQRVSTSCS